MLLSSIIVDCCISSFSHQKISQQHTSSIFQYFFLIFCRRVVYFIIKRWAKYECPSFVHYCGLLLYYLSLRVLSSLVISPCCELKWNLMQQRNHMAECNNSGRSFRNIFRGLTEDNRGLTCCHRRRPSCFWWVFWWNWIFVCGECVLCSWLQHHHHSLIQTLSAISSEKSAGQLVHEKWRHLRWMVKQDKIVRTTRWMICVQLS